ncbi:DUF1707 domain-containing protein [Pseudonocardia spirodelae]|uniref:DUF1707 domain-containing protein n=1 Tax=Pseudonocardia spirodelae TaxID=3133431 RepID=A0ABU8TDW8_9PSEU
MSTDPIGYAEQEEAVRALSRHYTGGRLDVDAFDERVRRARSATTRPELAVLFSDLPEPHPAAPEDGDTTAAASAGPSTGPTDGDTATTPGTPAGEGERTARLAVPDPTRETPRPDPSGHPAAGPYPDRTPTGTTRPPWPGPYGDTGFPAGTGPGPYPGGPGPAGGAPWAGGQWSAAPPAWAGGPQPYPGAAYPPHPGPPAYGGYDPAAPFGREPYSGLPYSDKQKVVAGLLQLFLPIGIGRFYSGHIGLAIAQLVVTFVTLGFGAVWSFIDGIVILAGSPRDPDGRPLRP